MRWRSLIMLAIMLLIMAVGVFWSLKLKDATLCRQNQQKLLLYLKEQLKKGELPKQPPPELEGCPLQDQPYAIEKAQDHLDVYCPGNAHRWAGLPPHLPRSRLKLSPVPATPSVTPQPSTGSPTPTPAVPAPAATPRTLATP